MPPQTAFSREPQRVLMAELTSSLAYADLSTRIFAPGSFAFCRCNPHLLRPFCAPRDDVFEKRWGQAQSHSLVVREIGKN